MRFVTTGKGVLAAAAVGMLVLSGCTSAGDSGTSSSPTASGTSSASSSGSGAAPQDATIGLISFSAASPGVKLYADAFQQLAEQKGWTVKYVDTNGDAVAAVNQTKQWIDEGVDAIVNDTIPNSLMTESIAAANAAGIPFYSVSAGTQDGVTNETSANEWVSGSQLASALMNRIGRKGNVIKLTWSALQPVRDRAAAFDAVVSDMKDVKVVKTIELKVPGWADDAYKQLTNYFQTNKDVQAIWMPWDDFAPDVVRAVDEAGLSDKVIVGGFDLDDAAADLLRKDGPFQMSNALNIPAFAALQIQLLEKSLAGETVDPITYVPNCLATPENIPATGGRGDVSFWTECYAEPGELEAQVAGG